MTVSSNLNRCNWLGIVVGAVLSRMTSENVHGAHVHFTCVKLCATVHNVVLLALP